MAAEFLPGVCEEGIELLALAGGVTPETMINGHGTNALNCRGPVHNTKRHPIDGKST